MSIHQNSLAFFANTVLVHQLMTTLFALMDGRLPLNTKISEAGFIDLYLRPDYCYPGFSPRFIYSKGTAQCLIRDT